MTAPAAIGLLGDGQALRDILALAGPDMAARILAQVVTDLRGVDATLSTALRDKDHSLIRSQTHVLISVAGTIGAARLHALAVEINTAAHDRAARRIDSLSAALLADLRGVIALLAARLPDAGAS